MTAFKVIGTIDAGNSEPSREIHRLGSRYYSRSDDIAEFLMAACEHVCYVEILGGSI
jgi:hypothetical protein